MGAADHGVWDKGACRRGQALGWAPCACPLTQAHRQLKKQVLPRLSGGEARETAAQTSARTQCGPCPSLLCLSQGQEHRPGLHLQQRFLALLTFLRLRVSVSGPRSLTVPSTFTHGTGGGIQPQRVLKQGHSGKAAKSICLSR